MQPQVSVLCGHSMEVSVAGVLEVLLSTLQLQQLASIFHSLSFLSTSSFSSSSSSSSSSSYSFCPPPPQATNGGFDNSSNLPTTSDTTITPSLLRPLKLPSKVQPHVPIDLLITCLRLDLLTYNHHSDPGDDGGDGGDGGGRMIDEGGREVRYKPVLNLVISQPYLLYVNDASGFAKLDVSFYDISLKCQQSHSPPQYPLHQPLQPHHSHFLATLLDTKAGQPHPTTGVSSSVFLVSLRHLHSDRGIY